MKLKIFSDRSFVPKGVQHDFMLSPFWGKPPESPLEGSDYPWTTRFIRYAQTGPSLFEMTSLEEADVAIMPINWMTIRGNTWRTFKINRTAQNAAIEFAQIVEKAGKPLIVFFEGDCSDEKIPLKNAIVFRESLYRSKRKINDFPICAFNEDIVEQYFNNQLPIRQKRDKPVVGFCGFAKKTPFWQALLKDISYHAVMLGLRAHEGVPPYKGHTLRYKALRNLSRRSNVNTNFEEKEGLVFLNSKDVDIRRQLRLQFLQNMVESDYILCCRGAGNFSYRLNETLCCGRIPVFINTDCVLPYESQIDWKKYCVWVEEDELPLIGQKVAEFHNNFSPQEFIELQYECRKLWQQWICPEGFFSNFYRHFELTTSKDVPEVRKLT